MIKTTLKDLAFNNLEVSSKLVFLKRLFVSVSLLFLNLCQHFSNEPLKTKIKYVFVFHFTKDELRLILLLFFLPCQGVKIDPSFKKELPYWIHKSRGEVLYL